MALLTKLFRRTPPTLPPTQEAVDPIPTAMSMPPTQDKLVALLESENELVKSGLATIQEDLGTTVELNRRTLQRCDTDQGEFRNLVDQAQVITKNSTELNGLLDSSAQKMQELSKQVEGISVFLKEISDIALKTNLLALNASVEAARVGEAGKGFAVVANEVKSLSKQATDLVERITDMVETINQCSGATQETLANAKGLSSRSQNSVQDFDQKVDQAYHSSAATASDVSQSNDRVFVSLAKLDHVIWKVNTYLSVIRKHPVFQFVSHHDCRLGKWYYQGDGRSNFSRCPSYPSLERPHEQVHSGTKAVFKLIENDSDLSSIQQALRQMEQGSEGVFAGLDRILREARSQREPQR